MLAVVVGLAHAAKLSTRTATVPLPAGQAIGGVAKGCPGAAKAVGGGASVAQADDDYVTGSYPIDRDQWAATGWAPGADETNTLTVHVRCVKGLRVRMRSESEPLPTDGAGGSATARCPRGTRVTGGGAKLSNEDRDYLLGSYPKGRRSWTASAFRFSNEPSSIRAFVLCVGGEKLTTKRATVFVPAENELRTARTRCPRGTKLTGGGFRLSTFDGLDYGRGSYPAGRRGWVANGSRGEPIDPESSTLTAYVRCLH